MPPSANPFWLVQVGEEGERGVASASWNLVQHDERAILASLKCGYGCVVSAVQINQAGRRNGVGNWGRGRGGIRDARRVAWRRDVNLVTAGSEALIGGHGIRCQATDCRFRGKRARGRLDVDVNRS